MSNQTLNTNSWLNRLFASGRSRILLIAASYLFALIVLAILLAQRWTFSDILIALLMFPLGLSLYLMPILGWFFTSFSEDWKTITAALTGYLIYISLAIIIIKTRHPRAAVLLYIILVILLIANVSSCVSGMNTY